MQNLLEDVVVEIVVTRDRHQAARREAKRQDALLDRRLPHLPWAQVIQCYNMRLIKVKLHEKTGAIEVFAKGVYLPEE